MSIDTQPLTPPHTHIYRHTKGWARLGMAVHTRDPAQAVRAEGLSLSQPGLHTETLSLKRSLCVVLGQQSSQGFSDMVSLL